VAVGWRDLVISISEEAISALLPGLGLTAKAGILIGSWIIERATGTGDPADLRLESEGKGVVTFLIDNVKNAEDVSVLVKEVSDESGRPIKIVGFAFDAAAILEGYSKLAAAEEAMKAAVRARDRLFATIKANRERLESFAKDYERWHVSIESLRILADRTRAERDSVMREYGY